MYPGRNFPPRRQNRRENVNESIRAREVRAVFPDGTTERRVHAFGMRWYLRPELEHLVARAGFTLDTIYGNFDRSPLTDASPEMIVVARVGE